MHAESHARLMNLYAWVTMIGVSPLMFLFGCAWLYGSASLFPLIGFFIVWAVLHPVFWYLLPVHCKTPGCGGRMKKTNTSISPWKCKVEYRCNACEDVFVAINLDLPTGDFYLP